MFKKSQKNAKYWKNYKNKKYKNKNYKNKKKFIKFQNNILEY